MHKLFAILMVLFALGRNGQAQDAPKVEVFTGYSFMSAGFPFSTDPAAGNGSGVLNGWNFSAAVNANRWIGVVADFGGYYGSPTKGTLFKPANCVLCTSDFTGILHNMHTFTAGPQLSIRQDTVTVFAHALFGGAHIREDLVINNFTSDRISSTNFAFLVGGGVNIALSHRFALRIQPDYLRTEILGRKQNNFRASAGLVFRFGQ
ncbi:MAG TPA: outer membrane beta-barrel protein [Candidatus Angelobacter sp.]|nr:outer membrane beta-barrel protein [Candidatus Angelobacter sp.]